LIREDVVNIIAELSIIDKAILHLILSYQRLDLSFGQFDVQGTEACSESCLSNISFSQFVKVNEKFFDSNAVLGNQCLQAFLNIKLHIHVGGLPLLSRWMETVDYRDCLSLVLEGLRC
jgi:hypothetical protein